MQRNYNNNDEQRNFDNFISKDHHSYSKERYINIIKDKLYLNKENHTPEDIRYFNTCLAYELLNVNCNEVHSEIIKQIKHLYSIKEIRNYFLGLVKDILVDCPGNVISLATVIAIAVEHHDFFDDLNEILQNICSEITDLNEMLIFFSNLNVLEKYGLLKEAELERILEFNGLMGMFDRMMRFDITDKVIENTKSDMELDSKIEIVNQKINTEPFKEDLRNTVDFFEKFLDINDNTNGDLIMVGLIVHSYSFSIPKCRKYLFRYFSDNYNIDTVLYGLIFGFNGKGTQRSSIFRIFLDLTDIEGFLLKFYEIFPKIYSNEKLGIKDQLTNIMVLLYEKLYHVIKSSNKEETNEKNNSYDPQNIPHEKKMFLECIDEKIFKKISYCSDLETMDEDLRNKFKNFIEKKENLKVSDEINLKELIKNGKFDDIKKIDNEKFVDSFLYISQPSISHFLGYTEVLSGNFALFSKDDQDMFCNKLWDCFSSRPVFLKHVCEKICMFDVVENDVREKHPLLFSLN